MAKVSSVVDKINNLRIVKLTGSVRRAKKCVRVSGYTIILLEDGSIATDPSLGTCAYGRGTWRWTAALMRGLARLGILDDDEVEEHLADCEKVEADREKREDRYQVQRVAEKYGLKIPKKELDKIQR